jgi:Spy/CpxP family protein refolding chaperone
MKRRYMWMGIAGLILAIGVTAVHARGHRGRNYHFAGPRFEEFDLTETQKDQLKSLRTDAHKKMIQLRADAQLAHVELKELIHQKNPSQKFVDQAVDKVTAAQASMMKNRVQQKLSMNKILTDEKLQKLEEMPRGHRRGGRRGHRGGPGDLPPSMCPHPELGFGF